MDELKVLLDGQRDNKWLEENRPTLEKKYMDMYVAINDRRVLAAGKDVESVIRKVARQGVDPALVLITFLSSEDLGIFY